MDKLLLRHKNSKMGCLDFINSFKQQHLLLRLQQLKNFEIELNTNYFRQNVK